MTGKVFTESYFVITNSDGDVHIDQSDRATLEKHLDDGYYGDYRMHYLAAIQDGSMDLSGYLHDEIIIIKGSMIFPEKIETVVEHRLP